MGVSLLAKGGRNDSSRIRGGGWSSLSVRGSGTVDEEGWGFLRREGGRQGVKQLGQSLTVTATLARL